MKSSQEIDISQIVNTIYRRKDIVVAIFLVIAALSSYLAFSLPNVYRSSTLILITPQRLPSNYVASTVTSSIDQRMLAMTQQILSRTSLEKIVTAYNLYSNPSSSNDVEARVDRLRKLINVETNRNDTFRLSFVHESPQTAMKVTARLASLFIDENVRSREQQAAGTTAFINIEVERLRKELEQQESIVSQYRTQYQKELPEQLDANLRTLEQMGRELESGRLRLTSLEERKAFLEASRIGMASATDGSGAALSVLAKAGIDPSKKELELLRNRYSDKHPDVIRLKQEIERTKTEATSQARGIEAAGTSKVGNGGSSRTPFDLQSDALTSEIALLRQRNSQLQSEIAGYQNRVNNTPNRATELSKITRNYDITLRKFQELLSKEFDSQLSENMEKKQKGEQFQVVDPASLPKIPFAPNRWQILMIGLVLGLVAALAAAILMDNLDTSIKGNQDLNEVTDLPLLAALPIVPSRGNILELRQGRVMLLVYCAGALALGMYLIRVFGPMLTMMK